MVDSELAKKSVGELWNMVEELQEERDRMDLLYRPLVGKLHIVEDERDRLRKVLTILENILVIDFNDEALKALRKLLESTSEELDKIEQQLAGKEVKR